MSKNKIKFWVEDFKDIFRGSNALVIIPRKKDTLEERFNALTRLTICISIILMLLIGVKYGVLYLLLTLMTIIVVYYSKVKEIQENFTFRNNTTYDKMMNTTPLLDRVVQNGVPQVKLQAPQNLSAVYQQVKEPVKNNPTSGLFCTAEFGITSDQGQYSLNQKLAEGYTFMSPMNCKANANQESIKFQKPAMVNPNTKKAPVVVAPIYDLGYWRDNDFVNYSRINDQRIMDKYQSGYYIQECPCGDKMKRDHTRCFAIEQKVYKPKIEALDGQALKEHYSGGFSGGKHLKENYRETSLNYGNDNISPVRFGEPIARPYPYVDGVDLIEDPSYQQPGDILTVAGYNPNNLKYNLPVNAAFGNCEKQPVFDDYNKDLYTQTIQPGYFSRSQVNDPISSNIGISFDQQFVPTTLEREGNDLTYIEHDPRQFKPKRRSMYRNEVTMDNVYDPRSNGYGTSYRSYVDRLTGQPRFYYDDVDAIRRPNYVTRNKLDTFDFGETYGPMKPHERIISDDCNINDKAQQKFLDDAIGFRTSLQQSLMRKRNNEMWQLRKFPLSRAGQKNMAGGGGGARGANGGTNC